MAACSSGAPRQVDDPVEIALAGMDLHARAARIVVARVGSGDAAAEERLRAEVATGSAGGLLLRGTSGRAEEVRRLRAQSPHPLLVVVDLDSLVLGAEAIAPARFLAVLAPDGISRASGALAASAAQAVGGDVGLIALPPLNDREPLLADARDPERVADGVRAYAEGAAAAGLPVIVRALWRPDSLAPTLRWDRARLEAIELREVAALVDGEVPGVELGSVSLPAITGDSLPLPLSLTAVEGLLRRDLGFAGLVVADISADAPLVRGREPAEVAVEAVAAGADLLLGVSEPAVIVDALAAAVEGGRLGAGRIEEAARRVLRLQSALQSGAAQRATPGDSVARPAAPPTAEALALAAHPAVIAARAAAGGSGAFDSLLRALHPDSSAQGRTAIRWPPAPILRTVSLDSAGMRPALAAQIDRIMREALDDSVFSAGAVAVGRRGGLVLLRGWGRTGRNGDGAPVDPRETIFDLASLTKVVGTTTAISLLVDDGLVDLDEPVESYLPEFDGEGKDEVRIRDLLTHTSGMPAGLWLFGSAGSPDEALGQVLRQDLLREAGEEMEYSDLGMILLAEVAQRVAGMPLDRFLALRLFAPLGMQSTMYLPPLALRQHVVPTAERTEREFALQGVVHDANSFRLGGVAGHAGIFSTAADLAVFAQMLLNGGSYGSARLLAPATVSAFTTKQADSEQRALGWDTPSRVSSAGDYFSARSFGHTGYTGTSLWIDPTSGLFVVLLTNRTYTAASGGEVLRLRAAVHDAAARAIIAPPPRRRPGAR